MGKRASKDMDFDFNAIALEPYIESLDFEITQKVPEVTSISDAGPRRVVDNYDYGWKLSGFNDYASALLDATLFARIGAAGAAVDFEPTGANAGANDPNYTSTDSVLESYSISIKTGESQTYSAQIRGNSALVRAVA